MAHSPAELESWHENQVSHQAPKDKAGHCDLSYTPTEYCPQYGIYGTLNAKAPYRSFSTRSAHQLLSRCSYRGPREFQCHSDAENMPSRQQGQPAATTDIGIAS